MIDQWSSGGEEVRTSLKLLEYTFMSLAILSLAVLCAYLLLLNFYNIEILPEIVFWGAIITFGLSMGLLWMANGHTNRFLLFTLMVAFVFRALYFFRFYYYGYDILIELANAQLTQQLGRWPLQLIGVPSIYFNSFTILTLQRNIVDQYYATTSVTILPSSIASLTGAPMITVFRFLIPEIAVVTALVVFLIARLYFGNRVASLAMLLYIIGSPDTAIPLRQQIAFFFFLFAVFYVLRDTGRNGVIISMVCLSMVAISHYGTFYFATAGILAIYFIKHALNWSTVYRFTGDIRGTTKEIRLSSNLVLFAVVAGLAWLIFVAFPVILFNFHSGETAILAIFKLAPKAYNNLQSNLVVSSEGIFSTFIEWVERIVSLVGLFVVLLKVKLKRTYTFALFSAVMIAITAVFAFLPDISFAIDAVRVLSYAFFAFSILMSAFLVYAYLKNRHVGVVLVITIIIMISIEFVFFPIVYSTTSQLGVQQYEYSSHRIIPSFGQSDFEFASWIQSHTNSSSYIASDNIGYYVSSFANRTTLEPAVTNSSEAVKLILLGRTNYFLVKWYDPGIISYPQLNGTKIVPFSAQLNSSQVDYLLNNPGLNRISDNSLDILFGYS